MKTYLSEVKVFYENILCENCANKLIFDKMFIKDGVVQGYVYNCTGCQQTTILTVLYPQIVYKEI